MEIEAIADYMDTSSFEDSLPYERRVSPRIQHTVDTITHVSEESQIALAWYNSGWCPWNWGDKIRQFESWVERKINSEYDKECQEAENAEKEYKKAKKEWDKLPHEEKLVLQEANRTAMELRYPNLVFSEEVMNVKLTEVLEKKEQFIKENINTIESLPIDLRNIIFDSGAIALGAIITASTNGLVFASGVGIMSFQVARLSGDIEKIKMVWEDLEANNKEYFEAIQNYNDMVISNRNASYKKCEKEGYTPELRFIENVPKHLLDFSEWYVDINAGPGGGPAFSVGYDWSF